jgi:hypothetical protein
MNEQLGLFAPAEHRHGPCHDCGSDLGPEPYIPATCERFLDCTGCCQPCQMAALGRMIAVAKQTRSMRHFPGLSNARVKYRRAARK